MSRKTSPSKFDAIIFGSGIQGLLLAKRLLDLGQKVALIEKSATIAKGASSKNHGWIHQGTTHSLSAKDSQQGLSTTRRLQYGYNFFKSYAPECFDEPLNHSYAVTNDSIRAAYARDRWEKCGVPYKELTSDQFFALEPDINRDSVSFFFQVTDGRLNNRLLFLKLYTEIKSKGALILTMASYEYASDYEIKVMSEEGDYDLTSPLFLYATGAGMEESYRKFTGESLGVECFKSHMIFTPRLSNYTLIDIDYSSPIIVNHGNISAINRAHDEVLSNSTDTEVDPAEIKRTLASLYELYPKAKKLPSSKIMAIACLKPCIPDNSITPRLLVEASIYEPRPGHMFALPGKMTAAPYVTDEIVKLISPKLNLMPVTPRPYEIQSNRLMKTKLQTSRRRSSTKRSVVVTVKS